MRATALASVCLLLSCGSPGKAKPAELELSWPDAAALTSTPPRAEIAPDAHIAPGAESLAADAGLAMEAPR